MTLPGHKKLVNVGSYRLTGKRLGRGNFAKVEEAYHSVLKAKVAIKVLNISEIKEDYVVRNLHREARLMAKLNHPYIAALYETMQNGSIYYLVTELVGGGDLCTYIKAQRGGRLEEKLAKSFGRQLVSAVAYMHNMGIVHRDLKMENIMLTESKAHLKIVDFGLSNTWSADTPLHTHCGSPEYAAPELFVTGQLYGPQVDIWSLGVILYGMVIGQLPFQTSKDMRLSSHDRRKHLLSQINRGLATQHRKALAIFTIEFRAMLVKLLAPDPAKRMRLSELVQHPWLTDKNRRPLRTSGLRDLDSCWKTIILKEIGKLSGMDGTYVDFILRTEPYGTVAGMYNILTQRRTFQLEAASKQQTTTGSAPATSTETQRKTRFNLRPTTALNWTSNRQANETTKTRARGEWINDIHGTPSRIRIVGSRNYNQRSTNKETVQQPVVKANTGNNKFQNLKLDNRRTKSEPIPNHDQTTSHGVPTHTAERAQKRRSEQLRRTSTKKPITVSKGRSSNGDSIHKQPMQPQPKQDIQQEQPQQHSSRRRRGSGDQTSTHPTRTKSPSKTPETVVTPMSKSTSSRYNTTNQSADIGYHSKHDSELDSNHNPQVNQRLLNEPITRCIAGYVDKYMNTPGLKMDQGFCIVQPSRSDSVKRYAMIQNIQQPKHCRIINYNHYVNKACKVSG